MNRGAACRSPGIREVAVGAVAVLRRPLRVLARLREDRLEHQHPLDEAKEHRHVAYEVVRVPTAGRARAPAANSALHSVSSGAISGSTSQALRILARRRGVGSGRPRAASTAAAVRRAARWAVA